MKPSPPNARLRERHIHLSVRVGNSCVGEHVRFRVPVASPVSPFVPSSTQHHFRCYGSSSHAALRPQDDFRGRRRSGINNALVLQPHRRENTTEKVAVRAGRWCNSENALVLQARRREINRIINVGSGDALVLQPHQGKNKQDSKNDFCGVGGGREWGESSSLPEGGMSTVTSRVGAGRMSASATAPPSHRGEGGINKPGYRSPGLRREAVPRGLCRGAASGPGGRSRRGAR